VTIVCKGALALTSDISALLRNYLSSVLLVGSAPVFALRALLTRCSRVKRLWKPFTPPDMHFDALQIAVLRCAGPHLTLQPWETLSSVSHATILVCPDIVMLAICRLLRRSRSFPAALICVWPTTALGNANSSRIGSAHSLLVSSPLCSQTCALADTLPAAHHPRSTCSAAPLQLAAAMRPNAIIILVAALAALACGLPLASATLPIIWDLNPQLGLIYGTTTTVTIETTLCGNCNPVTAYASCRVRGFCRACARYWSRAQNVSFLPLS
jgi:hypothetical protein